MANKFFTDESLATLVDKIKASMLKTVTTADIIGIDDIDEIVGSTTTVSATSDGNGNVYLNGVSATNDDSGNVTIV